MSTIIARRATTPKERHREMSQSAFVRPGASAAQIQRDSDAQRKSNWRAWLIGRPLSTADAPHQAIGKAVGLAVFSSDALSSTAYATQEILIILAMAGTAALSLRAADLRSRSWRCSSILTISYEQTIHAYPGGGGAYIVARDNLGELAAQVAGAALLMDYILTVSRVGLVGRRADHLGLPGALRAPRRDRRGARGLRDVRQPARA